MPLSIVSIFLPIAVLIPLVAVWPRLSTHTSSAKSIAEALGCMVLAVVDFICTVMVRSLAEPLL